MGNLKNPEKSSPPPRPLPPDAGKLCERPRQPNQETVADLCTLKTEVDISANHPEKLLSSVRKFQNELTTMAPNEIHPGKVVLYIASPKGKRYRVHMLQGKEGTPKDTPFTYTFPDGESVSITRKDENGYNSEYDVLFGSGKGTLLGIIFTIMNPEIKIAKARKDRLEKRIEGIRVKIGEKRYEILQIDAVLNAKNSKKKHNKPDPKKIQELRGRKKELEEGITALQQKTSAANTTIAEMNALIKTVTATTPHVAFAYSPYHPTFNTGNIRKIGAEEIGKPFLKAYTTLIRSDPSMANDVRLHTPLPVVYLLNIIERMGYHEYIDYSKKQSESVVTKDTDLVNQAMEIQMEKALTTFALNRSGAYNWQTSDVGATGVAQLMPDTYYGLKKKYPTLLQGTPEKYAEGARKQEIAMQLQAVHVYDQYTQFPGWIQRNWKILMEDPQTRLGVYMVLACGYNGTHSTVMNEVGITPKAPKDIKAFFAPDRILEQFRTLGHKWAAERYTYALKFQFLYKRLGLDAIPPEK